MSDANLLTRGLWWIMRKTWERRNRDTAGVITTVAYNKNRDIQR